MGKFKVNGEIGATSHISTNGWFSCSGVSHSNGWALGLNAYDKNVSAVLGGIGFYGASDGALRKIFLTFGEESWTSTLGLTLSSDGTGRLNNSLILTAANYNDYSPTLTGTGASGTWSINITGNAGTATKLKTARTISLTGSVTGSGSFDGSGNLSIATTTNHTHSYLPLSGGTITATSGDTPLVIQSADTDSYIGFRDKNGTMLGYYGVNVNKQPVFYNGADRIILHASNFSSYALPLSGGTLTGELRIGNPGTSNFIPLNFYRGANNNKFGFCGEVSGGGSIYASDDTGKTNLISVTLTETIFSTQIKLAITGGGWYNPVANPSTAGMSYDASGSTGSTYWPIVNLKFPNSTFSLGGERASDVFGIFRYANTRKENGYDAAFYCNGGNNYFYCSTRVYGAVWNDYAEFRNQDEGIEPGYCVASNNNGKVYKTNQHLQACDGIVSDTYGFSIGETDNCKTPLAVSGRVLAYYEGNKYDYNAGDTVGASANGKVIKMTREEITKYPDRIVGIVSEIPEYDTWGTGNISTAERIWIKVK